MADEQGCALQRLGRFGEGRLPASRDGVPRIYGAFLVYNVRGNAFDHARARKQSRPALHLRQRQSQPQRKTWRTKILASRGLSRSLFNARNLNRRLLRSRAGGCYELVDEDIQAALQSLNPSLFIRLFILEMRRSEERRVGKECVRSCGSGVSPDH